MGEVWRARDTRLGRDVALKVLPKELRQDPDRLRRFEHEARAVSALNHPNIVTIYDVGAEESTPYIAMELLEGRTLREELRGGALPMKKLLQIAGYVAEGLSRAHEAGIVHRDVKPENVMICRDGVVKILDFGLAKRTFSPGAGGQQPTATFATEPGSVLGTVRYMSPEQAAGKPIDFRTDQFSFGSVLYEMATGKAAFQGETNVDTLSAILHAEPEPIARINVRVPTPLRWVVDRCLAKDPKDRYASTLDLARDLGTVREHLSEVSGPTFPPTPRGTPVRRHIRRVTAAAALATAGILVGVALGRKLGRSDPPVFRQLTFRSGYVWCAYFAPDERNAIFAATWEGRPLEIFMQRIGSPEFRSLRKSAGFFGISRAGELALQLGNREFEPWSDVGTLARMEMASETAPREVLEDVQWAGWAPNGKDFAIVHDVGGRNTLEYPIGTVLYQATGGWISHPTVSRNGNYVAFVDHPVRADDAGSIAFVDRKGNKATLVEGLLSSFGLGWSPNGDEVWFTGTSTGTNRMLQAVNLSKRRRVLARVIGSMLLQDVGPTGRVLLTHDDRKEHVFGIAPGETTERELSWLDYSLTRAISRDGKKVLFVEGGEGAGTSYAVFLRGTDGSPATRLGEGDAQSLSPDGRFAAAILQQPGGPRPVIYPTGAGPARILEANGLDIQRIDWMPDGQRFLVTAGEAGHAPRLYLQSLQGGAPRPISPEGYLATPSTISPDGSWVVARGPGRRVVLFPLRGGEPVPLRSSIEGASPCGWTADGAHLYVILPSAVARPTIVPPGPRRIGILDVKTGEIVPWKTLGGEDGANSIRISPDGRAYVYSFVHSQGDLFLLEGVK
jgi:hypothetical protein